MKYLLIVMLLFATFTPAKAGVYLPIVTRQGVLGVDIVALHCPDEISDVVYPLGNAYFDVTFDSEGVTKGVTTNSGGAAYIEGWSTTAVTVEGYHGMKETQPVDSNLFFDFYYCETGKENSWSWSS